MAIRERARVENAAGEFYVDDQCISCGACWRMAPAVFGEHGIHAFAFVERQPRNPDEVRVAAEALEICPVQAIGRFP